MCVLWVSFNLPPRWRTHRTHFRSDKPTYRHPIPTTCWRGCAWSAGCGVCPHLIPGAKQSKERGRQRERERGRGTEGEGRGDMIKKTVCVALSHLSQVDPVSLDPNHCKMQCGRALWSCNLRDLLQGWIDAISQATPAATSEQ